MGLEPICDGVEDKSAMLFGQVRRIEQAGGNICGGRLASGLEVDDITGDVTAVVSRDREGNATVHPADAVIFAIGIKGGLVKQARHFPVPSPLVEYSLGVRVSAHIIMLRMQATHCCS